MKIWIKLLIGITIGILLSIILPANPQNPWDLDVFKFLSDFFIHIGAYIIFPLVLFSLVMSTYELKLEKKLLRVYGQLFLYIIATVIILGLVGIISGLILPGVKSLPPNVAQGYNLPSSEQIVSKIIPKNLFHIFAGGNFINSQGAVIPVDESKNIFHIIVSGNFSIFLLPILIFALIIGLNLDYERHFTKQVVLFTDGMSRIMYHINSFVVEVFWLGLIAITTSRLLSFKIIQGGEVYIYLILVLCIDLIVVIFGIFPLLLYFINNQKNPYKWLYATIGPALTALFTGDTYISLGMLVKHGKESLNVSRKIGGTVYPFAVIFGKAGTALVICVSLIFLRKTILGPEIPFLDILWIWGGSIIVSFFTIFLDSSFPASGAYAAIVILCYNYLPQHQFLGLENIAFILISFAVLINVITSSLISYIIAQKYDFREEIEIKKCI